MTQESPVILLIDDNHQLRDLIRRALEGADYQVMDTGNPRDAIHHLETTSDAISLLLIDGVMPQMLGPDAAAAIEKLRPGVPVMLMSGHEAPMFTQFFGEPGHHFIAKPFVLPDLVSRVAALIGPGR